MPKKNNKTTGKKGEEIARGLLEKKGYNIIETNWGNRFGEIDIIAKDGDVFVFVEVKTKVGAGFGSPEEMVNWRKLNQVQRMANMYFKAVNNLKRIDVVAVVLDEKGKTVRIDHYEAVY